MLKRISLLLWLCISLPVMAAIEVHEFDDPDKEQLFKQLTAELRCPKCQNQSIADSDAALAVDLREKVYQMVQSGADYQQVVDYMVSRYGNFIHYQPPMQAMLMILFIPLLFIAAGIGWIVWRTRTARTEESAP